MAFYFQQLTLIQMKIVLLLCMGSIIIRAGRVDIYETWETDTGPIRMGIRVSADDPNCITSGTSFTLTCIAFPELIFPTRDWYNFWGQHNEEGLDVSWNEKGEEFPAPKLAMAVRQASESNAGNYTCVAKRGKENFEKTIYIDVKEAKRQITVEQTRVKARINDSITLSCHMHGSSPSHFTWQYYGLGNIKNLTSLSSARFVTKTDVEMTLRLTNVTFDSQGVYECVSQVCSDLIKYPIALTVLDVPKARIENVKAVGANRVWLKWNTDYSDDFVEQVAVKRIVNGTGRSRYGEKVIIKAGQDSLDHIVVNNLTNGTTYKFEVVFTNSLGDSLPVYSEWVTTLDEDPAYIPKVTIEGATIDFIKVWACSPPIDLLDYVHYYEIMVTHDDGGRERHTWTDIGSPYVIKNLKPATGYRLQVAACNVYVRECGDWSNGTEVFTTDPDRKFIPTVSVKATTHDSIMITWLDPPISQRYQIYEYKVKALYENDRKGPIYLDKTTRSYVFRNLKSNVTYLLKVAACVYLSTECDDWSDREAVTIDRDPGFVPQVSVQRTTLDSILICWTSPPPELQNRVHQYKVMATCKNTTIGPIYLPNSTNSHIFDNLAEKTTFQVKVAACSLYISQCGNWSTAVNGTTVAQGQKQGTILWSSLAAAILLVILLSVWVAVQKYRERGVRREFMEATLERFNLGSLDSLDPALDVGDQAELLPYNNKWEFPRELLTLDKILGQGAFGVVRKAEARSICRREEFTIVAVKLVRATARLHCMTALTRELKILANLGKHLNIVNLLGACTKNVPYGELFVIVEFCRFGNLRDYLLSHRADFVNQFTTSNPQITPASSPSTSCVDVTDSGLEDSTDAIIEINDCASGPDSDEHCLQSKYQGDYTDENLQPIRSQDLLCWAWQVTQGMMYLGSKKILHGDLAARNILLADNNVVKICDFGMSRSLYTDDNYHKKGHEPLPIKWMAIESLRDRIFSVKSDVWSFGVVLWELFTLGQTPYPGIHPENLYQKLVHGLRMSRPKFASPQIYQMMLSCWHAEPSKRASFKDLANSIAELLEEDVKMHYIDLNIPFDEMNAEAAEEGDRDYLTMSPAELKPRNTIETSL